MDGFRTLEAMRRAGLTMPVIVLTARGAETDKVHGLRLGADDYVTKPFGLSELMARVAAQRRCAGRRAPVR
jgi:two-component system alkaline phosphatase synthesis response regulator PhoP